ncbi:MAG TPA: hypothetical protein VMV46_20765 [Thermoanaerobaculia bacterium]|nr:hypothetical protein [Thermoanaerobaculia bacterium]
MMANTFKRLSAVLLAAGLVGAAAEAQVTTESSDVQGPLFEVQDCDTNIGARPIVESFGATLRRSDQALAAKLVMPTPVPGTYCYPPPNAFQPVVVEGEHPETYSLWMFVFNYPDLCSPPGCDASDFAPAPAMGGVFSAAGHVVGGPNLVLSGQVSIHTEPFRASPLLEPRTAEVHLAVAAHGRLLPEFMPTQITFPIGSAPLWWVALFKDAE